MRLREILPITEWIGTYSLKRLGSDGVAACRWPAHVDEGMGEAANVCWAQKARPKSSASRPTNACGSLASSDADHGKKRDPRG
jgi:hypothetical protein